MIAANSDLIQTRSVTELVTASQAGDRQAFGELFERFHRLVFATALKRLRNQADAEELCQDVFVQAMLKIRQLRQPEAFNDWLRQITIRMAINRAVRRGKTVFVEPEVLEATVSDEISPVASALESEQNNQIHTSLHHLRSIDREALVAYYIDGQSVRQISIAFGVPLGTIKRRLFVARKRLAKEIRRTKYM